MAAMFAESAGSPPRGTKLRARRGVVGFLSYDLLSPVMGTSAWAFGWESLAAVGTLTLALFTFGLAWVTRRLAQATALEVQSQSRPILIPIAEDFHVTDVDSDGYYTITIPVRNIGAGPAVRVRFTTGPDVDPWESPQCAVLPPGEAATGPIHRRLYDPHDMTGPYPTQPYTPIKVDYLDMAGRLYATETDWMIWKNTMPDPPRLTNRVTLTRGLWPADVAKPPRGDVLALSSRPSRTPLSARLSAAARVMFPRRGEEARSWWRRFWLAVQSLRTRRTQTFSQRIRWGLLAYRETKRKPIPPEKLTVRLVPMRWPPFRWGYVFLRGLKYGIRAFRQTKNARATGRLRPAMNAYWATIDKPIRVVFRLPRVVRWCYVVLRGWKYSLRAFHRIG
jgi:hypothetical protein